MTNPNDDRGTDDASALRRATDPEANPVIGSGVDDPDLQDALRTLITAGEELAR